MKQYIEVMCPVCGRTMSKIILNKVATGEEGMKVKQEQKDLDNIMGEKQQPRKPYLDYLSERWDINKNEWGFIRDCPGGRGSGFPIIGYYTKPEDNINLFNKLKRQLLNGIKWFVNKGWLTKEEILQALKEIAKDSKDTLKEAKKIKQTSQEALKKAKEIETDLD